MRKEICFASQRLAFNCGISRAYAEQGAADNNWGKSKPKGTPISIEDMMKTKKGLKEFNKMTTQDLWKKAYS